MKCHVFKVGEVVVGDRPLVMGVLNITPDSFSDGNYYLSADQAFSRVEQMISQGVDMIDVGAESSRHGSVIITPEEEIVRLKPFLSSFKSRFSVPFSLDTCKPEVARFGLECGVDMINDISGLEDPVMQDLVASYGAGCVVMHRQGISEIMQENPVYEDVVEDVFLFFKKRLAELEKKGISSVLLDPGIGFGKTVAHNLALLKHLDRFLELGCPLLVGTSRKSFIGAISGAGVGDRLAGTLSSSLWAVLQGACVVRVHDVAEMKQALSVLECIQNGGVCV